MTGGGLTAAFDRLYAGLRFLHESTCVDRERFPCMNCPAPRTIAVALDYLDAHPRDARAVRRIFHDAVCSSGCGPDSDHADRTQAQTTAALRRFRASERVS